MHCEMSDQCIMGCLMHYGILMHCGMSDALLDVWFQIGGHMRMQYLTWTGYQVKTDWSQGQVIRAMHYGMSDALWDV